MIGVDIMKKKMETSKKLALFVCICFAVVIVFCMAMLAYSLIFDKAFDFTLPVTLITVVGGAFSVTEVAYSNKARYENVSKIQQSNLREKYLILKDVGAMDENTVRAELESTLAEIETEAIKEKEASNQEIVREV